MELNTFPKSLKIGKISPIHEKGDVQLLNDYRPISFLPIFGKISEKILYKCTIGQKKINKKIKTKIKKEKRKKKNKKKRELKRLFGGILILKLSDRD